MASKRKLFLSGYFREIETISNHNIPQEITDIVIRYQTIGIMFGIGMNCFGQFGTESVEDLKSFTQLPNLEELGECIDSINRNHNSLMIITDKNELYVAGSNECNRLGLETINQSDDDEEDKSDDEDNSDDESNNCYPEFTRMPLEDKIKFVSTGTANDRHTFLMTETNELYASGANYSGELANGKGTYNFDDTFLLIKVSTSFLTQKDEYIVKVECGRYWSLFLTNYGSLYSSGSGATGHSGFAVLYPALIDMNNDNVPIIAVATGYSHTMVLDENKRLITWGGNHNGQTNSIQYRTSFDVPTYHEYFHEKGIEIEYIDAGTFHSLCIDIDGNCYLFGCNDEGQIGTKDIGEAVSEPFKINDVLNDKTIVNGSCGEEHTVLLSDSNNVIAFGSNRQGEFSSLKEKITGIEPYVLSKTEEIGILESSFVEKVMAINYSTLIFVDPNRSIT